MKAGLVEIADIFVVNKSDRDGSERLAQSIHNVLHVFKNKYDQEPPVYKTTASAETGIDDLFQGIDAFINNSIKEGYFEYKRIARYRNRVHGLVQEKLTSDFWTQKKLKKLESIINEIEVKDSSPYDTVKEILKKSNG